MKLIQSLIIINFLLITSCKTDNEKNKNGGSNQKSIVLKDIPALKNLYKQVKQHPDSTGLRLKLVYTLDSLNVYKEALQQIDTLIREDSLNYGLWFTKGNVAEHAQDTLLAMQSYANAAKIYESPDALLSLANLYAETKNDRALLICSRVEALALGREYDAHCAFITGIFYARTGSKENALKKFDECIANNYTYMEAYIEKGLVYFDKEEYDKALNVFQFAVTVNSLYADAYYYQARCYEMMNKKDSAIEKFQQSLRLDNTLVEAQQHMDKLQEKH